MAACNLDMVIPIVAKECTQRDLSLSYKLSSYNEGVRIYGAPKLYPHKNLALSYSIRILRYSTLAAYNFGLVISVQPF